MEGCYFVRDSDLKIFLRRSHQNILILNLNHCYWLSSKILQWTVHKCQNLRELHILECRLRVESVVSLLRECHSLQALSFSIGSFSDIKLEHFTSAKATLNKLKRLSICYTSRSVIPGRLMYVGEHNTLLDLCSSLLELHILASGRPVFEIYRPIISQPSMYASLKIMTLTDYIHAGAQMIFYGSLSQIDNNYRLWHALLMPNLNFAEFQQKSEFADCLRNVGELRQIDLSGSRDVTFPNSSIDLSAAVMLTYLNIASSSVDSLGLTYIADCCPKIVSLNLFECPNIFKLVSIAIRY